MDAGDKLVLSRPPNAVPAARTRPCDGNAIAQGWNAVLMAGPEGLCHACSRDVGRGRAALRLENDVVLLRLRRMPAHESVPSEHLMSHRK